MRQHAPVFMQTTTTQLHNNNYDQIVVLSNSIRQQSISIFSSLFLESGNDFNHLSHSFLTLSSYFKQTWCNTRSSQVSHLIHVILSPPSLQLQLILFLPFFSTMFHHFNISCSSTPRLKSGIKLTCHFRFDVRLNEPAVIMFFSPSVAVSDVLRRIRFHAPWDMDFICFLSCFFAETCDQIKGNTDSHIIWLELRVADRIRCEKSGQA
jgi:hypothetical protein